MAQLSLTVAGYAIGSFFGPFGAQVGGAVGAYLGASLLAEDVTAQGPRLEDRKVQTSAYGQPVGYSYGATRVAGNVIWAADLEEVATETEVGGKGGPTQSQITYSYFATFAAMLVFGEQRGARRVWCDSVLVYDGSRADAPPPDFGFTFYPGTETQDPDPTIEAAVGVGLTPAYRGYCYVVFNRLPLERFGNRIPSITVELLGDGEWQSTASDLGSAGAVQYLSAIQRLDGQIVAVQSPSAGTTRLAVIDPATGSITQSSDTSVDVSTSFPDLYPGRYTYISPTNEIWVSQGLGIERYSAETLAHVGSINTVAFFGWNAVAIAYNPTSKQVVLHRGSSQVGSDTFASAALDGTVGAATTGLFYANQLVTGGSAIWLACAGFSNFGYFTAGASPQLIGSTSTPGTDTRGVWDPIRQRYVVFGSSGSSLAAWTVSDANPPSVTLNLISGGFATSSPVAAQYLAGLDAYAVWTSVAGVVTLTVIDAESLTVLVNNTSTSTYGVSRPLPSLDDPGRVTVVGTYRAYNVQLFGTTVGATVSDLCQRGGVLTDDDLDVSDLTDRLRGYVVPQSGPVRGAVEQLAKVYFFDGVEADDKLLFRARGGSSIATITADQCGAGVDTRAEVGLTDTRAQELDLPRRYYLTAPDPFCDHQPGTQYAERQTSQAGDDESLSVATVLTATESKRCALSMLYDRWASRYTQPFETTRELAHLVPTDVVTLDGRRMRITSRSDEGSLIRWEAVADDAEVRDQTATGVQGAFPGQEIAVQVPTNLFVLDIALLRDSEDYPGAYIAAYGIAPQWRGSVIYTSADSGTTWTRTATMPAPGSTVGSAVNALGNFYGGNIFDELGVLRVSLNNGTLSSNTREGALAGTSGLALQGSAGWEILEFRDAVLEDDGTYTVTGLLRGRKGTEYAMGGHVAGGRVIFLSSSLLRDYQIDSGVIGLERPYRAVTVGDTISGTPEQDVTVAAERLMPLSPVHLGGGRNASADVILKWVRRTRVGGEWRDSVDASLGESSESYTVRIFADATYAVLKRTVGSLTSPTTTYAAADQIADFGSTQSVIYWDVRQASSTVGLGHAARGTV